jgi:dTDP-4-amino-4,6-dideoxygalactose transaminase
MDRMIVPLLDLQAQYARIREEVREAIDRVCNAQQFIMGPEVEALEAEVGAFCGMPHAVGMSSGTDALLAALMVADVGPGDEVVTAAYSFFATAGTIARLGARAVFVDIDLATFNVSPAAALGALNPRTKAVVPVHLFGRLAEVDLLVAEARRRAVPVIEDAAQAIGARDAPGRAVGGLGASACLSFFPSKNLGGFGDGGMVLTSDAAVAERLRAIRVHGARRKYYHEIVGGNFRLDAIQAAVLRVKLRHLERWNQMRRRNAQRYRELFAATGVLDWLTVPADSPGHVYNQFVVRCPGRDELRKFLAAHGVGSDVYYPLPLHLQPCFRAWGYAPGDFPAAEQASRECLALPVYPELTEVQQRYVADLIARFHRSSTRVRAAAIPA